MKTIKKEAIAAIIEANEAVRGTEDCMKYDMQMYFKGRRGQWVFSLWTVPYYAEDAVYKKVKDNEYIIMGDERYVITDEVKKILKQFE